MSPYRIPLYNYLHGAKDFNFRVIALAEKEANREWQVAKEQITFDYHVLPGLHKFIWSREIPIHLNWGLWRSLRRYKPDIVITSGYDALAYWEAFLYCKLFKKKYILWNGTTMLSTGKTAGPIGWMKRRIVNGAERYVTYGTKAAEYLVRMGAPEKDIHVGVNTVDMDWFKNRVKEIRSNKGFQQERAGYPRMMILYVGQLIRRKGLFQVLKAIQKLGDSDIGLLIVGSGPQEEELRRFCEDQRLENVYFEGFQQQDALPKYYALADVLVLPSFKEVWGLVVNEALASGLYVSCSNQAGAAYDLIKEGWNGALFDPRNVEELAMLVQQTKVRIEEIRARREAISEHACREFSIERSAKAFLDAIKEVRDNEPLSLASSPGKSGNTEAQ
jgi:glycosyltransferase involved in cell wall biosynthesis